MTEERPSFADAVFGTVAVSTFLVAVSAPMAWVLAYVVIAALLTLAGWMGITAPGWADAHPWAAANSAAVAAVVLDAILAGWFVPHAWRIESRGLVRAGSTPEREPSQ